MAREFVTNGSIRSCCGMSAGQCACRPSVSAVTSTHNIVREDNEPEGDVYPWSKKPPQVAQNDMLALPEIADQITNTHQAEKELVKRLGAVGKVAVPPRDDDMLLMPRL